MDLDSTDSQKHRSTPSASCVEHDTDRSDSDSEDLGPIDKEYGVAARAVARCVDLFCHPRKAIDFMVLLEQEEAAEKGEVEETEAEHTRRTQLIRAT